MEPGRALENLTSAIVGVCRSGLSQTELRDRVLPRLRRVVPFDAAFWATVDPATLLFTQPHQEEIPADTIPYFVQNEFLDDDVNKWTTLARDRIGVRTLVEATAGNLQASPRYRDIFAPLGLGDELRAVLRLGGVCWGYICLHREAGAAFSADEAGYVRRLAPHLAEGIRAGILVSSVEVPHVPEAPGLVVLAPDGSFISTTAAGEQWLQELGHPDPARDGVPAEIRALAALLQRRDTPETGLPRLRVRTRSGRWAMLHASRLASPRLEGVAVIIEKPSPAEIGRVLMLAYGLTRQEQTVTLLVCRGLSTREIAERLYITMNTVQDHLKSIFDKVGVRSRRELVASILQEQYLPRAMARQPVGPSGFFVG
ncbi:MAG TPA: helix-turn-helix transcriptional regulator [Candidatus Dormibacteraeota bacterium]|nr:helix-turn-helix transcriptional regulator [Candidatus Dormibacteraeota bacterium]